LVEPAAQRVLQLAEAWLAERLDHGPYPGDLNYAREHTRPSGDTP
jgi:hypothetical protein